MSKLYIQERHGGTTWVPYYASGAKGGIPEGYMKSMAPILTGTPGEIIALVSPLEQLEYKDHNGNQVLAFVVADFHKPCPTCDTPPKPVRWWRRLFSTFRRSRPAP